MQPSWAPSVLLDGARWPENVGELTNHIRLRGAFEVDHSHGPSPIIAARPIFAIFAAPHLYLGHTTAPFDQSRAATLDAFKETDYYAILSVSRTASFTEIKEAYHRALLVSHPDKRQTINSRDASAMRDSVDIGLLQRAYAILSSDELRGKYDAMLIHAPTGPRPAQVVSLEEFTELETDYGEGAWSYGCRCGGQYVIKEGEMERDQHLVGCTGCSEVVWVGYEQADE